MKGLINIYIEKNTKKFSILIYHVTKIGFSRSMGSIIEYINNSSLKQTVYECLKSSLANYQCDDTFIDPFKKTKFKTWNRFFNMHYVVEVTYREKDEEYEIKMPIREQKTKSFGHAVSGFDFKINKKEYNAEFDNIMKKILDNIEKYQN